MSKYLWLLDNGHGGMIAGKYQTEGKRSPEWADGSQLYEGEFNRAIVNRLAEKLTALDIAYVKLTPSDNDISLYERVIRAKAWCQQGNCILVSIHANYGDGTGKASGVEVFTTVGNTPSDKIAQVFIDKWAEIQPKVRLRTDREDGDDDKEENFQILRKVPCPAILTENFFMDNEYECKNWLMTGVGRAEIVDVHLQAILAIEEKGLNNL